MVSSVRMGCFALISTPDNDKRILVILHHQVMTAKPLFDIFRAMLAEFFNDPKHSETLHKRVAEQVVAQIGKEYSELVTRRNELLHGTWYAGWVRPETEDDFWKL